MSAGIRAEVSVTSPESCPIARMTNGTGASTHSVSRSAVPGRHAVVEEFEIERDAPVDVDDLGEGARSVFSYGSTDVYRFTRDDAVECPCETIEGLGGPIVDATARNGTLHLSFHAPDMESLSATVSALRSRYDGVSMERLVRSDETHEDHDLVFVDRSTLTDRQLEALVTAHEMGYFDHPKGANAGEVAAALGITTSTFTEHLSAAQSKLLADILEY